MRASGGEGDEELDFTLTFGEELEAPRPHTGGSDLEADDSPAYSTGPSFTVNRPIGIPRHGAPSRAGMHSPPPRPVTNGDTYESQPARLIHLGGCKVLACPSIQITSISPGDEGQEMEVMEMTAEEEEEAAWGLGEQRPQLSSSSSSGRDQLYLPLDPFGYRECSLSPSSASSFSSWGWLSDGASSCGSTSHVYDDVEPELREAALRFTLGLPSSSTSSPPARAWPNDEAHWASPGPSPCPSPGPEDGSRLWPRGPPSRPASPGGKRRHPGLEAYPYYQQHHHYYQHRPAGSARPSPCPSPVTSRRGSITDEAPSPQEAPSSPLLFLHPAYEGGASVPHKTRRTSQEQTATPYREGGEGEVGGVTYPAPGGEEGIVTQHQQLLKKDTAPMEYLTVPSPFVWSKARIGGHSPVFRSGSLPPLDWPLPNQYEALDLKIEVQPKTHHRAHYETEGSRGAVKAAAGGHPVVKLLGYSEKPLTLQMFIGTADDRNLRPHAFYQVHRITGKMVATASQEAVVGTTKVLEVSLLPENNMTANIDCAGILKLRNSDIELRKGETDVGRKNTRVKLVFRVHVPQPNGKVVSLQAASVPIECSQRSAHELPQVESYNITTCPVTGGEELLLTGCNFLPESKVIFIEKGPVPIKEEPHAAFELGLTSPLRSPVEYPLPASTSDQGPTSSLATASPSISLSNPACPGSQPFGRASPFAPHGFLIRAGWNEPCAPIPPGFAPTLTRTEPGRPLSRCDDGRPLTQSLAQPFSPSIPCYPSTQANRGHPLAQRNHSYPLTQADRGQPLAHPPLGPSCSYSPPHWALPCSATGPYCPGPGDHFGLPGSPPRRSNPSVATQGQAPAYSPCAFQDEGHGLSAQKVAPPHNSSPPTLLDATEDRPFPESESREIERGGESGKGPTGVASEKPKPSEAETESDVPDCEVPFRTISIQGITLDDVNEIIGRDLTDVHEPLYMDGAGRTP
ncbi:LOW QUALITY PROTEIN: nuclear factor of activated T-cells, cytoplasmic 4 [Scyliorhinus canicula]|uniref:LOW QUALITY PROTEIN: nuclear factor of activated T-cells, cytoplasmic 4 n=1 Tax=Scyliorhinus canicula TaxID=7830 RepID=UPI0018F769F1|nr:LOW QUALITY PROTEIN: nuclear factor of activated T-cells, cytoplasmic 4 [Scyliorhinus canicula]